jgi:hypothetical protein
VHVPSEQAELLLERPGPSRLKAVVPDGGESTPLRGPEVGFVEKPELPPARESGIVFGLKNLVVSSSNLIDRLSQVLGDMELIVHHHRLRGLVCARVCVGR